MTSLQPLRIVHGAEQGRHTILQRQPLDELAVSPDVAAGIERMFGRPMSPDEVVATILADVRSRGDEALRYYTRLIDGADTEDLAVPQDRIEEAWRRTPERLKDALSFAADRIEAFHERQPRNSWLEWDEDGGALGQMVRPIERVGIYAPNGRAPYPSSLLMAAIPARVAGVPEIIVASPPRNGEMSDSILAAAHVAGVSQVYALGGAQAIGALAYGTESVRKVDKILGPGSIFVVLAKKQVYGAVDIDLLPGPTETLLIADETADVRYVAADLLAQAEHDPLASAILITTSESIAERVADEVAAQFQSLSRREVIAASLAAHGGIVVVDSIDEALDLANEYAPEHLCLLTRAPFSLLGRVRNAGGVFLGEHSSEALGDYAVGPSHIMPTGQTARFSSPVNVWDFCKITSVFGASRATARQISRAALTIAHEEGLTAHARAIYSRFDELEEEDE